MAFELRNFKDILETSLSYVVGHSDLTDVNPGSNVRTLMEAQAIELAQLYIQMQAVLNLFSIDKSSGDDLDERAADYGLERLSATQSTGTVTIGDSDLTAGDVAVTTLKVALTLISTTAVIQDADFALYPASGFIVVDRGSALRERIEYTSKTGPDTLNLATTPVNTHSIGASVHLSTTGTDRTIVAGTTVKTTGATEILFDTVEEVILYDGDYQVANVLVQSKEVGSATNVDAGQINSYVSPPFPTATVTNVSRTYSGTDRESDADFRARIKESQQSLSSSTADRIKAAALQVEITGTGQRVFNAQVIEPVAPGEIDLYISDGTSSYIPDTVNVETTEIVIADSEAGQVRFGLNLWPLVSSTERLFVSIERGTSTSVGADQLTDYTKSWTLNQWAGFKLKSVNNVFYDIVSNTVDTLTISAGGATPASGDYAIFDPSATLYPAGSLMVRGTDYVINDTNGQFELDATVFPTGLQVKDSIVAYYNGVLPAYTYYTGLLREVQRVINGDPTDLVTYPGVKAAGSRVNILVPSTITVTVDVAISVGVDVDETTVSPLVATAILNYINGLDIGEDVRVSRIIGACLSVTGVEDVIVNLPMSNIVITESQLAKTTLAAITVT